MRTRIVFSTRTRYRSLHKIADYNVNFILIRFGETRPMIDRPCYRDTERIKFLIIKLLIRIRRRLSALT